MHIKRYKENRHSGSGVLMILIRGIKGETYARKIEKGIVDCRDLLSTLLLPPVTGYEYSDYFEKNLVKALAYFAGKDEKDFRDPQFLYSILIDHFIPHIYLTYFHIVNEYSLEWLDKFDDDYKFIAIDVKIDRITKTVIGNEFFSAKMAYVDSIRQLCQDGTSNFYAACMCSIENLFTDKKDMIMPLQIYNTLAFALLCREQDEKFTDIENEFRIIAYDCPRIQNGRMKQVQRMATLSGANGVTYKGVLNAGIDTVFKSDLCVLNNPNKLLSEILVEQQGGVTLDSQFKSIDVRYIADQYTYLGGKANCAKYIKETIKNKPKDIYVDRTVLKEYKLSDIPDAVFAPGYQKVEY